MHSLLACPLEICWLWLCDDSKYEYGLRNCILKVKWSSLHLAAGNGHTSVVEELISSEVNVDALDKVN